MTVSAGSQSTVRDIIVIGSGPAGYTAAIAGAKAAGGNTAAGSAALVGAVTVDGHPGVLYLVAVGPAKVAVALAGCSSTSPDVLASATL